jgi:alpha-D-xyloside xylohydrolase
MANLLTFDSGPLQARIDKDTGSIALAGPDLAGALHANVIAFEPPVAIIGGQKRTIGRVISSTQSPNGLGLLQDLGGTNVTSRLTFPTDGVMRYEVVDFGGLKPDQTSIAAASDGNEHFYGFGEKFNALDQSGNVVDVLTFDHPGNKGDRSYKVAPWFISTRGYGLHLDSTAQSTFDMRAAAAGRYTVTNHVGTLTLNVVYGPALSDVLSRYTGLTGRPTLPPPWAFGPWISSDIWRDGGEVNYAVTKFRQRGIPVSAFVFDSPWEVAYNDFKFNIGDPDKTQFGHPGTFEGTAFPGFANLTDMMTFLRKNGLKVICWMAPFINVKSNDEHMRGQNLGEAKPIKKEDRFFVRAFKNGPSLVVPWWKGHGSPIDFTSKDARDWLTDRLNDLLTASLVETKSGKEPAIGGFKTDDGESGNGTNTYIPETAVYGNGRTGREFVNGYCLEYLRTVFHVLGEKGLIFARSGFTGTQAFPGCWAGDNEPNFGTAGGLPSVIVAGLSSAMSGFSIWGHDIGGYLDGPFSAISPADLFIRWTQFGCFSPIMQMHRTVNKDHELRQYPWGYPEAGETTDHNRALANYQFYATLHTRLFPYIYSYAKQSSETGLPILRPLVLIHQDDARTFSVQHTYYFGGDLLVAPVIEPLATKRQVYLPEGDWFDFWTNERHAGKQDVTWKNPTQPDQPQSKIPVFVRRGAILPLLLGEDVQTLCDANYVNHPGIKTWDGGLEVRIYPAGTAQFTLFEGTNIQSDQGAAAASVTITSSTARPVLLRVLAPKPVAVRRDGAALAEVDAPAAFEAAGEGWRFDATPGFVLVKFSHPGGATRITL